MAASEAVHAVAGVEEAEVVTQAAADDHVVAGDAVGAQDRVAALPALERVGTTVANDEVGAGAALDVLHVAVQEVALPGLAVVADAVQAQAQQRFGLEVVTRGVV